MIGLIYYFSISNETNFVLLTSISLVFSLLISYLRARIEGLGYNSKSGFFTRPERVLLVSLGLIFFSPELTVTLLALATAAGLFHRFLIFFGEYLNKNEKIYKDFLCNICFPFLYFSIAIYIC